MSVLMLRVVINVGDIISPMAQQPLLDQGLLIIKASRSHWVTLHSLGLLWTSEKPDVGTATWQHTALTRDISMMPAGVEPPITASERPLGSAIVVDVPDNKVISHVELRVCLRKFWACREKCFVAKLFYHLLQIKPKRTFLCGKL
jgi:hypothetical protein